MDRKIVSVAADRSRFGTTIKYTWDDGTTTRYFSTAKTQVGIQRIVKQMTGTDIAAKIREVA